MFWWGVFWDALRRSLREPLFRVVNADSLCEPFDCFGKICGLTCGMECDEFDHVGVGFTLSLGQLASKIHPNLSGRIQSPGAVQNVWMISKAIHNVSFLGVPVARNLAFNAVPLRVHLEFGNLPDSFFNECVQRFTANQATSPA